jgi:hypothetical protein
VGGSGLMERGGGVKGPMKIVFMGVTLLKFIEITKFSDKTLYRGDKFSKTQKYYFLYHIIIGIL